MYQSQLDTLYQDIWPKLKAVLPLDRKISNPLFIHVPAGYEKASVKLVVIGRETHGWFAHLGDPNFPANPQCLVEHYRKFNLGEKYVASPFWWAAHELQRKLEPSVPSFGFVWTNLFICDQNQTTPEDDIANQLREISILKDELKILQPDAVVFFTGWRLYDYTIRKLFPGVEITSIDGAEGKLLSKVSHANLPAKSYRTYHPKYLRMRNKMSVLESIAKMIIS